MREADDGREASEISDLVRISTGSRLHFGLYDVKAPFGGVGLMVDLPRTSVSVCSAESFEVHPCPVVRISEVAQRLALRLPSAMKTGDLPNCRVVVESAAEPHCGLGSGTQMSVSAAVAMSHFFSLELSRYELVNEIASRGRRSSIGSIGFFEGGLIAENGQAHRFESNESWRRVSLPLSWCLVLAYPDRNLVGISGEAEGEAFATLEAAAPEYRRRLVQLGDEILKLGAEGDFAAFSSTVATFNELSGDLFASHQGGCYNGVAVASLVHQIRSLGVRGVGQSSWGPMVFAFCENQHDAERLVQQLPGVSSRIVKPQNEGYKGSARK